ncbi:MAG: hypothetical protein LBL32_03405 [Holosporales bacterium]|jgi:hypothetical protein|nr:hypothetical protein [Holosporales bacterium]
MKGTARLVTLLVASCLATAHGCSDSSDECDEQVSQLLRKHNKVDHLETGNTEAYRDTLRFLGGGLGAVAAIGGIYSSYNSFKHGSGFWKTPVIYVFTGVGGIVEVIYELKGHSAHGSTWVLPSVSVLASKFVIGGCKGAFVGTAVAMTGKQCAQSKKDGTSWFSSPKNFIAVTLTTALGANVGSDLAARLVR